MTANQMSSEWLRRPARSTGRRVRARVPLLRWRSEVAALLLAASPLVLIGLLNMGISIVDMVMLGRYDARSLATVLVFSDLYSIVFNFSAGFAGVVTPRVAAAIGARVRWQVCTIVRYTLLLVLLVGACGATVILFSAHILGAAGFAQPESARSYAALMAATYVFMLLFALVRAVLAAMGRPGFAVLAIVAALPLKVAANQAFIWGSWGAPEMGVVGAGLASLLVALLMGGSLTFYLFRSPSFAEFDDPAPPALDLPALGDLARSGLLMGLIAVSETGVFLASTIVVGLFAPQELLVHALAFRSIGVCYLFVVGVGQAATVRMAYLYARGTRPLEVHAERAMVACGLALVALVLAALVACAVPLGGLLAAMVHTEADLAVAVAALLRVAGVALAAMIPPT